MSLNESNLTDYGYDFVVATTESSINATLKEYFANVPQSSTYICVVRTQNGLKLVTLEDIIKQSGINPFDLPDNINIDDPRAQKLTKIHFDCGIELALGLPNIKPSLIPDVVSFIGGTENIKFNFLCSKFKIIKYFPAAGEWETPAYIKVWQQTDKPEDGDPEGAWVISADVSLDQQDLDSELNTPYFNRNADQKKALKAKIDQLSNAGIKFSLRQLIVDLTSSKNMSFNTAMDDLNLPTKVKSIFYDTFITTYYEKMKENGEPIIVVNATNEEPDNSSLALTDMRYVVNDYTDSQNKPIVEDHGFYTLNYLCAANNHTLPKVKKFDWNWLDNNEKSEHGIISINRNTLIQFYEDSLKSAVSQMCIDPIPYAQALGPLRIRFGLSCKVGVNPIQVERPERGEHVLSLKYTGSADCESKGPLWSYAYMYAATPYECNVYFRGNTIVIIQDFKFHIRMEADNEKDSTDVETIKLTDTYTLSVDSDGTIKMKHVSTEKRHHEDLSLGKVAEFFLQMKEIEDRISKVAKAITYARIRTIPLEYLDTFVFPGANVFSFTDVSFSDNQDLTARIVYQRPTKLNDKHSSDSFDMRTPLLEIEGIGKVYAERLERANVTSVESLLALGRTREACQELALAADISPKLISTWVNHADLLRIKGMSAQHAELLERSGVHSVSELAQCHVVNLLQIMTALDLEKNIVPVLPLLTQVERWVAEAKTLPSVIEQELVNTVNETVDITATATSEMMTNYLPAELISPQEKFEALQTEDGHSLLFSIDTNGIFSLIQEQSGESKSGWVTTNLSCTLLEQFFSHDSIAKCDSFAIGQHGHNFSLAVVITAADGDYLYVAPDITDWSEAPHWQAYEYDCSSHDLNGHKLDIIDLFFVEYEQNIQHLVVDIVRDPCAALAIVQRFYVDLKDDENQFWKEHAFPIAIEASNYSSCLGRIDDGEWTPDGMYTMGHVLDSPQFMYRALFNIYSDVAPTVTLLQLPKNAQPDAIASTRALDGLSTYLFTVSGDTLYYFLPKLIEVEGKVEGKKALQHSTFKNTHKLIAMKDDKNKTVTLWGLTNNKQVYYTSCSYDELGDQKAWSTPVPILSNIDKISTYLNIKNGGNTIFAAGSTNGASSLQKIVQSIETSLWQAYDITLPPVSSESKPISFNSYTSNVQLMDDKGNLLPSQEVYLNASGHCKLNINGLHYLIHDENEQIKIKTNASGMLTIIEAVTGLSATKITLRTIEQVILSTIDPIQRSYQKIAKLDSVSKLKSATIKSENGDVRPLLPAGASDKDIKILANALSTVDNCYNDISYAVANGIKFTAPTTTNGGIFHDFEVAIGNLFNWLKSGVEAIIEVVQNEAKTAWYFVAKIANKVYRAVIDTVDAAFDAVEWLFNYIKTKIEDLIEFLTFIFEWSDIKRTKQVFHNLTRCYFKSQVNHIGQIKQDFDGMMSDIQDSIQDWSGISNWDSLGDISHSTTQENALSPVLNQTVISQHFTHHFHTNIMDMTGFEVMNSKAVPAELEELIKIFFNAIEAEANVFDDALDKLKDLIECLPTLNVGDIIKRFISVLFDGVLSGTTIVMDALFDILKVVAEIVLDALDTKIHIPVISDILKTIGIPELSILDLICWVGAVAYTCSYKLAEGKAPFADNDDTNFLINLNDLSELEEGLNNSIEKGHVCGQLTLSPDARTGLFVAGHTFAGIASLIAAPVMAFEVVLARGGTAGGVNLGTVSAVLAIVGAGSSAIANMVSPKCPSVSSSGLSTAVTTIRIINKVLFSSFLQNKFQSSKGILKRYSLVDGRKVGAVIDAFLIYPALACTGSHFYELSELDASEDRSCAIVDEVANIALYISRFTYTLALFDEDPESGAALVATMIGSKFVYTGLKFAEAGVGDHKSISFKDTSYLPHLFTGGMLVNAGLDTQLEKTVAISYDVLAPA